MKFEFGIEQINKSELHRVTLEWYGTVDEEKGLYSDLFKPQLNEQEVTKAVFCYVNIWLPLFDKEEYSILSKNLEYIESDHREQIRDMCLLLRGEASNENFSNNKSVKSFRKVLEENSIQEYLNSLIQ